MRKFDTHSFSNACKGRSICNMNLLEVTENFWSLSRTAKRFEILEFEVTSAESRNLAQNTKCVRFKMTKDGSQLLTKVIGPSGILTPGTAYFRHSKMCT